MQEGGIARESLDVSQLLVRWSGGDETALEELIPVVYGELRRLGRSALRRDGRESILQPTALVHEAWLRMAGSKRVTLGNRCQFYALAAKMMRDILVDQMRRRKAAKRGGSRIEVALDDVSPADQSHCMDFLILDEALTRLGEIGPRYAQIVEAMEEGDEPRKERLGPRMNRHGPRCGPPELMKT